jgi:hypothetical protein
VREENLNSYNPEALSLLLDFIYPDSRSEVNYRPSLCSEAVEKMHRETGLFVDERAASLAPCLLPNLGRFDSLSHPWHLLILCIRYCLRTF